MNLYLVETTERNRFHNHIFLVYGESIANFYHFHGENMIIKFI